MKAGLLLILIFIGSAGFAFANDEIWSDSRIYEAVQEGCSTINVDAIRRQSLELDNYRAGIFPSKKFNTLIQFLNRQSARAALTEFQYVHDNDFVSYVLESEGYKTAIRECFPNAPDMVQFFDSAIHRTSLRGKVIAGAATILIFRGTTALLAKLGTVGSLISKGLTFSMFAGIATTLYTDSAVHAKVSNDLKKLCGPAADANYSPCAVQNYQNKLSEVEAQVEKKDLDNLVLVKMLVSMAQNQVREIEAAMKATNDPQEIKRLQAELADRQEFIRQHS